MITKQMIAITNKKLFTQACAILHPCYCFDFIYFTQSLYKIDWKVEQCNVTVTELNCNAYSFR